MRQAAFSDFAVCLGKGEADSSILSGSTIFPLLFSQLSRSGLFLRLPEWQISARTNHKPAQSGVQNPCSLFFERSRSMMMENSPSNERNSIEWWRQRHAEAVRDCSKMVQDWFDFCEMMDVEVDSHEAVADAIRARYGSALYDAETALRGIAKDYDGEGCPYPIPLDQIGAELRKRQKAARDYFANSEMTSFGESP